MRREVRRRSGGDRADVRMEIKVGRRLVVCRSHQPGDVIDDRPSGQPGQKLGLVGAGRSLVLVAFS